VTVDHGYDVADHPGHGFAEPVEVLVDDVEELLECTAGGCRLQAGVVIVPAAATAWVRAGATG
jgi:hypothetical protein